MTLPIDIKNPHTPLEYLVSKHYNDIHDHKGDLEYLYEIFDEDIKEGVISLEDIQNEIEDLEDEGYTRFEIVEDKND